MRMVLNNEEAKPGSGVFHRTIEGMNSIGGFITIVVMNSIGGENVRFSWCGYRM